MLVLILFLSAYLNAADSKTGPTSMQVENAAIAKTINKSAELDKAYQESDIAKVKSLSGELKQQYSDVQDVMKTRHPGTARLIEAKLQNAQVMINISEEKINRFPSKKPFYGPTGGYKCEDAVSREIENLGGGSFSKPNEPTITKRNEFKNMQRERDVLSAQKVRRTWNPNEIRPRQLSAADERTNDRINERIKALERSYRYDIGKKMIMDEYDQTIQFKIPVGKEVEVIYNKDNMVAYQIKDGKKTYTNILNSECKVKLAIADVGRDTFASANPKYCESLPNITELFNDMNEAMQKTRGKEPPKPTKVTPLRVASYRLTEVTNSTGLTTPYSTEELENQTEMCHRNKNLWATETVATYRPQNDARSAPVQPSR